MHSGLLFSLALLLSLACGSLQAVTLDWDSVNWPDPFPRDLDQSFDIDPSNPGNDIRIQLSNSGTWANYNGTGSPTPDDTTDITGGLAGQESLLLSMDNTTDSQGITVTITFLYAGGVDDIFYTIFDVDDGDAANFIDQITNFQVNGASSTNVFIDGSVDNDVFNNGTSTASVSGNAWASDTSSDGNADISYGNTSEIYSISFFYRNDPALGGDPVRQGIAISDITYTVVPEPSTWLGAVLLAGFGLWHGRRKLFANKSIPGSSGI